jgi:pseudaminic acid synthase
MTEKVFIIAELSGNHNNSLQHAKDSIAAMKEVGADAVKLQTYRAESLTLDLHEGEFSILNDGLWKGRRPYDVFSDGALPYEWHEELFDFAKSIGIECFSTPFDLEAVDLLEELGVEKYKIGSFEIQHIPLIRRISETKKPVIISTGIATIEDIELALKQFDNIENVTLLKCTSAYPTPIDEVNLLSMNTLKEYFGCKVGISDHTLGSTVSIAAVAQGAKVIEKHFILDKALGGIDSKFSLNPTEFRSLIKEIRATEQILGTKKYALSPSAIKSRQRGRKIYVSNHVELGELITEQNIKIIRGNNGLHPKYYDWVLGKRFKKSLPAGTGLVNEYIEFN